MKPANDERNANPRLFAQGGSETKPKSLKTVGSVLMSLLSEGIRTRARVRKSPVRASAWAARFRTKGSRVWVRSGQRTLEARLREQAEQSVQVGNLDGVALCHMFNKAILRMGISEYLSASSSVGRHRHTGAACNASLPDHLSTSDFDAIKGHQKHHSRSPL